MRDMTVIQVAAAFEHQVEGFVEIFTGGFEVAGFVVLLAGGEFFFNAADKTFVVNGLRLWFWLCAEEDDLRVRRGAQRQFRQQKRWGARGNRGGGGGSGLRSGAGCRDPSLRGRVFGRVVAAGPCQGNGCGYGNAKQVALRVSVRQVWGTSD